MIPTKNLEHGLSQSVWDVCISFPIKDFPLSDLNIGYHPFSSLRMETVWLVLTPKSRKSEVLQEIRSDVVSV